MLIFDGRALHNCDNLYLCGRSLNNKNGILYTYGNCATAKMVWQIILEAVIDGVHILLLPKKEIYSDIIQCRADAQRDSKIKLTSEH